MAHRDLSRSLALSPSNGSWSDCQNIVAHVDVGTYSFFQWKGRTIKHLNYLLTKDRAKLLREVIYIVDTFTGSGSYK
jgi:hypothetical protein